MRDTLMPFDDASDDFRGGLFSWLFSSKSSPIMHLMFVGFTKDTFPANYKEHLEKILYGVRERKLSTVTIHHFDLSAMSPEDVETRIKDPEKRIGEAFKLNITSDLIDGFDESKLQREIGKNQLHLVIDARKNSVGFTDLNYIHFQECVPDYPLILWKQETNRWLMLKATKPRWVDATSSDDTSSVFNSNNAETMIGSCADVEHSPQTMRLFTIGLSDYVEMTFDIPDYFAKWTLIFRNILISLKRQNFSVERIIHFGMGKYVVKAIGTEWKKVDEPKDGIEISNSKLEKALKSNLNSTASVNLSSPEWKTCNIEDLTMDHFIKVDDFYFKPAKADRDQDMMSNRFERLKKRVRTVDRSFTAVETHFVNEKTPEVEGNEMTIKKQFLRTEEKIDLSSAPYLIIDFGKNPKQFKEKLNYIHVASGKDSTFKCEKYPSVRVLKRDEKWVVQKVARPAMWIDAKLKEDHKLDVKKCNFAAAWLASGLRWERTDTPTGTEISHEKLQEKLKEQTMYNHTEEKYNDVNFTEKEWETFGVKGLTMNHCIRVMTRTANFYHFYRPVEFRRTSGG